MLRRIPSTVAAYFHIFDGSISKLCDTFSHRHIPKPISLVGQLAHSHTSCLKTLHSECNPIVKNDQVHVHKSVITQSHRASGVTFSHKLTYNFQSNIEYNHFKEQRFWSLLKHKNHLCSIAHIALLAPPPLDIFISQRKRTIGLLFSVFWLPRFSCINN